MKPSNANAIFDFYADSIIKSRKQLLALSTVAPESFSAAKSRNDACTVHTMRQMYFINRARLKKWIVCQCAELAALHEIAIKDIPSRHVILDGESDSPTIDLEPAQKVS